MPDPGGSSFIQARKRRGKSIGACLERRLRAETAGETLFDRASRGRYATDASHYQVMQLGVVIREPTRLLIAWNALVRRVRCTIDKLPFQPIAKNWV